MLADALRHATQEVHHIRNEIRCCEHVFDTSAVALGVHTHEGDCNTAPSESYVAMRTRVCLKCGLVQEQREFTPNDGWTDWENTNI